jgi:hypothetical protein
MALTKIDDRGLKTPIDLLDNEKIRFGTGNDGEIYFDGTDSIFTSAGKFRFKHGTDTAIKTLVDGGVYLSHDNSIKFYTTASGVFVGGHIDLDDNSELQIGTGDDLLIYHDGNSRIQNTNNSCDFRTQSDTIELKANSVDEMMLKGVKDGAVELYYDNEKKIEPTSAGINLHEATDKVLSFSGGIGEIGSVPGFQGLNTAGSALTSIGMRGTDIWFATGSAERGRFTDTGLTFNGDTAAVNALDDYEEGSYTPTFNQLGTPSDVTVTHFSYTKIGRLVHIEFQFSVSASINDSSGFQNSLPFGTFSNRNINIPCISNISSSAEVFSFVHNTGGNILICKKARDDYGSLTYNHFSGKALIGGGTYETDA